MLDTQAIIQALLNHCSIVGLLEQIIYDNSPQFRSEFKIFCSELDIQHNTSSPRHPKVNGKVENSVKTVTIIKKIQNVGTIPVDGI